MFERASTLFSISCVVVCVLLQLTLAYPFGLSVLDDMVQRPQGLTQSEWDTLNTPIRPNPIKRECAGFPCMYTHMAEKAGRASLYRRLAQIIDACAVDPSCNPGRRKRSSIHRYP